MEAVVAPFTDLKGFTRLLASSPVARELAGWSSLTLLAMPYATMGADVADVLRYHVLLEYISPADLRRLPTSCKLVSTMFHTTGHAFADFGAINVTTGGPSLDVVRSPAPFPASNAHHRYYR
ncbi:fasciclin-like arabinogalactan protein 4 [Lolium perenne]|uniref:fasciclin-like arabinogalactan protein 4 n=1 Tax=Lolium perenne TaxID=4522 RepID=UPI003A996B53